MSVLIDADAFIAWERGKFDLVAWLNERDPAEPCGFPAAVWQELQFGKFAWATDRAQKRSRFLSRIEHLQVAPFGRKEAAKAAELAAVLKTRTIGFADLQIAATVLEAEAELLTFNTDHFERVPGIKLAKH